VVERRGMRRGRRGRGNDSFWGVYGLGFLGCLLAWLGVGWALKALIGRLVGGIPSLGRGHVPYTLRHCAIWRRNTGIKC
jgi:hypothetical protein